MPKIDRKAIIYQQAASLFMTKGYTATSMRDLADAVGIEPSSLYSHIKSKEDLLIKICMDTAEQFTLGIAAIASQPADALLQIGQVIDLHLKIAADDPGSVTVFSDEWRHLPEGQLEAFEQQRRAYQQAVKGIITQGMQQGVIAKADASILTKTILTSLRWIHTWHQSDKAVDYVTIGETIKAFVQRGLQA